MKTKTMNITGILLTLVMLVTMLGAFLLVASAESSGVTVTIDTGTSVILNDIDDDGYYEIGTADELYAYAACINNGQSFFSVELTADIVVNPGTFDENGNYTAKDGESVRAWTPIGTISKPYNSNFDGGNYTISGLFTKADGTSYVGLFGYVGVGSVNEVGVVDSYFEGNEYVGSIAGFNGGSIINCYNAKGVADGYVYGKNYVGGLVGVNEKNIINCYNSNNVSGANYVGGVVGQNRKGDPYLDSCHNFGTVSGTGNYIGGVVGSENGGTVQHCSNAGDVGGKIYVGGVTGGNYGTVKNCYNIGTVTGSGNFVGGVVGSNGNAIQGCYYLSDSETDEIDGTTFKTAEQFESGEVCRSIGYHVLNESCVCNTCDTADHDYENGFCTRCDGYQPGALNNNGTENDTTDDYYEIGNAGQLYWFAAQVNGGNIKINGELTANITVNENVLTETGDLNGDGSNFRAWTPIGFYSTSSASNQYGGTFDGNNKTVSGLYYNTNGIYAGLFGCISYASTVKDVGVIDSYVKGEKSVGGVVGYNREGTVINCYNAGSVTGLYEIGGVVGDNYGSVSYCYNSGLITGIDESIIGTSRVGGVVGINSKTVSNCYNTGTVTGSANQFGGVAGANQGTLSYCHNSGDVISTDTRAQLHIGGVSGYNNYGKILYCHNTGKISSISNKAQVYVGGVLGYNYEASISNCYNAGDINCSGTNSDFYVGGVVGYNRVRTVEFCYNTANVNGGTYTGGVIGNNHSATVANCYNMGVVTSRLADNSRGIVGRNTNNNSVGTVSNCYYLVGTAPVGIVGGDVAAQAEGRTSEEFASGEIAYLLGSAWGQTIGTDASPVFKTESNAVYYGYISCAEDAVKVYTNDKNASAEKPGHSGGTATCTKQAECEHCSASYGDIDENAHAWNEGVVTTDPTCMEKGVKTYTCTHNSAHTYTENVAIDENAHAWNEGVVTTNPTCSTVGTKTFTCTHNSEHTRTEDVAIDANAHTDYSTAWKTDEGEHWNECACGDKVNKAAHIDNNADNKCDTCNYEMPAHNSDSPDNPNNSHDNPDNNTPDAPSEDKDGLSDGAIAGIVIGSVAIAGIGGFSLFWFVIKKKKWSDLIGIFKK